jgi:hypothetical protein
MSSPAEKLAARRAKILARAGDRLAYLKGEVDDLPPAPSAPSQPAKPSASTEAAPEAAAPSAEARGTDGSASEPVSVPAHSRAHSPPPSPASGHAAAPAHAGDAGLRKRHQAPRDQAGTVAGAPVSGVPATAATPAPRAVSAPATPAAAATGAPTALSAPSTSSAAIVAKARAARQVATVQRLHRETQLVVPFLLGIALALAWRSCLTPGQAAEGIAAAGGEAASNWAASLEQRRRELARRLGSVVGTDEELVTGATATVQPFGSPPDTLMPSLEDDSYCGLLSTSASVPLPLLAMALFALRMGLAYATAWGVSRLTGPPPQRPALARNTTAGSRGPFTAAEEAAREGDLMAQLGGLGLGHGGEGEDNGGDPLARAVRNLTGAGGAGGSGGLGGSVGWVLGNMTKMLAVYHTVAGAVGDCMSFVFAFVVVTALAT